MRDDQLEGPIILSRFPVAFRPPALASWSSCSRRGVGLSLRSAYPPNGAGPRRGFRVSHARAAIGVGALSTPGTTVLILTAVALRPASVASQRRVPKPRHDHHLCGALLDEASPRVHTNSPVRSSPRLWPPDETAASWALPPSFAPGPYEPRTSGWGQVIEHGPESTLYVIIDSSLQSCVDLSMRATSRRTRQTSSLVEGPTSGSKRSRVRAADRRLVAICSLRRREAVGRASARAAGLRPRREWCPCRPA